MHLEGESEYDDIYAGDEDDDDFYAGDEEEIIKAPKETLSKLLVGLIKGKKYKTEARKVQRAQRRIDRRCEPGFERKLSEVMGKMSEDVGNVNSLALKLVTAELGKNIEMP